MLDAEIRAVFIIEEEDVERFPEIVRTLYKWRIAKSVAYFPTRINYYFLDRRVSLWAKFFGLFSKERKEKEIVQDIVKSVNEETLHQVIEGIYPRLSSSSHHSVIGELKHYFFDQFHYKDSSFSNKARKFYFNKK